MKDNEFVSGVSLSKGKYFLLSISPAAIILISEFLIRKANYPYITNIIDIIHSDLVLIIIPWLIPGLILPAISAFIIGLFFACSNGEKLERSFIIPTLLSGFFVFSIEPFFYGIDGDMGASFIQILFSCIHIPLIFFGSWLTAIALMVGSRVRIKQATQ